MRFASLGSGSRGNALLIQHRQTTLLIDCGFSLCETERRLQQFGLDGGDISAVLVTHEHGDHIRGVASFVKKYATPMYMTYGTYRASNNCEACGLREISAGSAVMIDDLLVSPFAVPHDAAEPCQFSVSDGDSCLGLLTDTGKITPHIVAQLSGCDALLLECNHDVQMLMQGNYPPSLKQRVGGDYGHLNNDQAAALLAQMDTRRLSYIAAMHISEKNNQVRIAQQALSNVLGWGEDDIYVADQDTGLAWFDLDN